MHCTMEKRFRMHYLCSVTDIRMGFGCSIGVSSPAYWRDKNICLYDMKGQKRKKGEKEESEET